MWVAGGAGRGPGGLFGGGVVTSGSVCGFFNGWVRWLSRLLRCWGWSEGGEVVQIMVVSGWGWWFLSRFFMGVGCLDFGLDWFC